MAVQTTNTFAPKAVGFGPRFVAYLIDTILLSIVSSGINITTFATIAPNNMSVSIGSGMVLNGIYFVLFWTYWNGQTLGKKAMNLKVVREDGRPMDLQTSMIRYIGYIISGLAFGLGFFWVLFDDKKQGWHDKIAQTFVVRV